jgi:hypothetical protein
VVRDARNSLVIATSPTPPPKAFLIPSEAEKTLAGNGEGFFRPKRITL